MNKVVERIETIRAVFLEAQLFYADNNNLAVLTAYLQNVTPEFRSIAYESISMSIAINDLEQHGELNTWLTYANGPGQDHQAQVHVALGWAIAKLKFPFLAVVEKIDAKLHHRVADGCGYYDGSFRKRQAILSQELPVYLPAEMMPLYDQGLGRSLWYSCQGDIHKIAQSILHFDASRHANFWRGVGIAVAYVGGCDDDALNAMMHIAGIHATQLACGAALAARSRVQANTMTEDTDRCARLWFGITAGEHRFSVNQADAEINYNNWLKQIEETLVNGFNSRA